MVLHDMRVQGYCIATGRKLSGVLKGMVALMEVHQPKPRAKVLVR